MNIYTLELIKNSRSGRGKVKKKEFRKMKPEDLEKTLSESRLELSKAFGNVKMGRTMKDHARIRNMRRSIARVLTLKNEARKSSK